MNIRKLKRLEQQALQNDQKITHDEVKDLERATGRGWVPSSNEKRELRELLERNTARIDPLARRVLEKAAGVEPSAASVPLAASDIIRTYPGKSTGALSDDLVYLGVDGTVTGTADISPYTRGYAATKQGPLRTAHGSPAPESTVLSADELSALRAQSPGVALDNAAKVFGANVSGFEKLANSPTFYNPDAESWWGKCHAWGWSSLSNTINKAVDVEGPEGKRGVWIGGQWLSRADMGNWMMGVADSISLTDENQMFRSELSAEDLVKGTTQFMMNNGGGVVADVWNDKKNGQKQVWNQPFVAADVTVESMSGPTADGLLAKARADGVEFGSNVKRLAITGRYGLEAGDDHENDPRMANRNWNLYAVTDATGKMVKAYMADDEKIKDVPGLPVTHTDEVPEYFWKPKLDAVNDVLAGKRNTLVERDPLGEEFKFMVGTVLTKGVPGKVRDAFEAEVRELAAGPIDSERAQTLAARYPGVANAYSPEQWGRAFGSRGLDAKAFGASWMPVNPS
ncbi:MAG: hypothetical protein ACOZIN_09000 [Myxococcota bacterium]